MSNFEFDDVDPKEADILIKETEEGVAWDVSEDLRHGEALKLVELFKVALAKYFIDYKEGADS